MARETFPYSYTSPYIHLWIFKTMSYYFLSLSFDPPHPTPSWPTHPTPPHPTPSWPTHPTPPHPTPSWPTPPHPFMTHPPHPTPPLHDPPLHDPPHPTPPLHDPPTPPHPTPPLVHFWAQRSLFSWAASLCLPLGRQIFTFYSRYTSGNSTLHGKSRTMLCAFVTGKYGYVQWKALTLQGNLI